MHTYGGLPAPLAVLAVLALAGLLALYYAAACGVFRRLAPAQPGWAALVFAALWLLAETGAGHAGSPVLAGAPVATRMWTGRWPVCAPWLGVYGISFVAAWLAAGLALGGVGRIGGAAGAMASGAGALPLVLLLVPQALPQSQGGSAGTLEVALLQGNIPQDEKFQPAPACRWPCTGTAQQLQQQHGPLVVAPETAMPLLPAATAAGVLAALAAALCQRATRRR